MVTETPKKGLHTEYLRMVRRRLKKIIKMADYMVSGLSGMRTARKRKRETIQMA